MSFLVAILTFVIPGMKGVDANNYSSSNARFTVMCDAHKNPPFKVVALDTSRDVLTLTHEQLGDGIVEVDWAPDDPVLILVVHRGRLDQVRVWRFDSGHAVDCSPKSPHDSLSLGIAPFFASNKLHLKGHKRTYTLTLERKRSRIE